ncbi:MAG: chain length-determining protein [Sulfurimicrobium sp.]|nr:chain length-determining protein [Sulfurimicrobium sp.]MDP1704439.1 chain length-determining protein [Sulfurimicrobium sp.]MDP1897802.1 chain length-determining protein [Sulfurimicrobium sp.]MDP2200000.1 chain length-determining protein [Sulfurimicrobium sp.]MDP2961392.1 chain length-determining protein [Sulfurimicrobium sp.]
MEELITQLLTYVKGVWKYRWYAVVAAWVVAIAGWVVVYQLPDDFQASARIYVDTQSVLKPLMSGMTAPPNVEQQVTIMSRTLISRPNVERVMRMVDLDIKAKTVKDHDEYIKELMSQIKIGSTGRDNLFTISYSNDNPKLAKDVVQSLLTIFVEGSLGNNKQESASALRFIEEQIKTYEEKLAAAETALMNFKQKNVGLMPGQGTDYLSKLTAAAESLNQAKLELREAEQARDAIKSQISDDEPLQTIEQSPVNPEIDARIQTLNKNLDALRLNFTEQHPDILSTKRLIAQLEERKKQEAKLNKNSGDPGKNYSPMLQQLKIAQMEAESRVASIRARVAEYSSRYAHLKSMSNAVPEVEADLTRLNRDYQVNKSNYESLIQRRESAKMSGEMSSTSELISFKIIDPPTVPTIPAGPDRLRLFSLVFLGAMLAGIGVAFILSQIRPTFHTQSSLREVAGRPILGTVAMIWTAQEKLKRKRRLYAFGLSLLSLLGLYSALMVKMAL